MNILKKLLLGTTLLASVALPLGLPAATYAIDEETRNAACEGVGAVGGNCADGSANSSISGLISTVVNILSFIVGVAAVIMIIIASFKYITAGGDTNSISSAKSTLTYALIGLVIAALAQFLVQFVLDQTTTTTTTESDDASELTCQIGVDC